MSGFVAPEPPARDQLLGERIPIRWPSPDNLCNRISPFERLDLVEFAWLALAIGAVVVLALGGLLTRRGRRFSFRRFAPPGRTRPAERGGDTSKAAEAGAATAALPEEAPPEKSTAAAAEESPTPEIEVPAPTRGRLLRLRERLSRSQTALGQGLLTLLSREKLDEDVWEDVEDLLLTADVGVASTQQIVEDLRTRVKVLGTRGPEELRALLRDELLTQIGPEIDRSLHTLPSGDRPATVLVVGVNGTGKTATCGKLARVLVADDRSVLLGAADTFRAAAVDQLATWGARVGAETVRGPEGADPASVAFDAVQRGADQRVDTVIVDTAGRLHTKQGLMDELGKVKRVVERYGTVDEVLLVLDATTGQNGLAQARVFTEVVDVSGVVLTKLDGSAKGGIVIAVQRELGVPVKLVGLGEGPDDLAPFEPDSFVESLLVDEAQTGGSAGS